MSRGSAKSHNTPKIHEITNAFLALILPPLLRSADHHSGGRTGLIRTAMEGMLTDLNQIKGRANIALVLL